MLRIFGEKILRIMFVPREVGWVGLGGEGWGRVVWISNVLGRMWGKKDWVEEMWGEE